MADEVVIRFDVRNPRAERLISQRAGEQITNVMENTRQAVRALLLGGYAAGQGPNDIALDLVGRINKASGHREGGVIGLTPQQTTAALNLRTRLASGDPAEMRKVLNMGLRDLRFDPTIEAAIKDVKPVAPDKIDAMYRQYVNNALRFRGEMIARTETGQAVLEASHEAFKQGLEKTGYSDNAVTKVWRSASDSKVRDSHAALDGQTVGGLEGVFVSPDTGAQFLYPMDDSLGAGPAEIINCRCLCEYNIDFSETLRGENVPPRQPLQKPPPRMEEPPVPVPEPEEPIDYSAIIETAVAETLFAKRNNGMKISLFKGKRGPQLPSLPEKDYIDRVRRTDEVLTMYRERMPNFDEAVALREVVVHPVRYVDLERGAVGLYHWGPDKIELGGNMAVGFQPVRIGQFVVQSGSFEGVMAHEVGHAVTEYVMRRGQELGILPDYLLAAQDRIWREGQVISKYAQTNWRETMAEAFAAWAHPDYRRGTLPRFFEILFERTLGK